MATEDLKNIKPYWAVGEYINQLLNEELNPNENRCEIIFVNTKTLIDLSDFKEVNLNCLWTGENINDERIKRILNHWKNGKHLDPPLVYLKFNKVLFADGRHRAKLSHFLGFKEIPIAVLKRDLRRLQILIKESN